MATEIAQAPFKALGQFARPQRPEVYSLLEPAYDTIRDLNKTLDLNRASNANDFSNYFSAFGSATPQFNQANQSNIDYLDQILNRNTDAASNYKDLLGFNLGQLNSQQNVLDQAGGRADNLSLAALGLGGNAGGGSYGSLARTNRISANTVPILNTIFGNTGQTAQSVSDQNYRDTLMRLGLLDQRLGMIDRPANRLLAPSGVRNQMLSNDTGAINQIVNAMRNNVLGLAENKSGLARWAAAGQDLGKGVDDAIDIGMSLYSGGMMGGGGAGGMMGGMGGMGGGQQGGGMNIQQLMQMFGGRGGGGGGGYASAYERPGAGTGEGYPNYSSFLYP